MAFALRRVCTAISILSLVGAILMVTPSTAQAGTTIPVTMFEDAYNWKPACSLRDAIQAANTDGYFGDCYAGHGADTIVLKSGTYSLSLQPPNENDLPDFGDLDITSDLTIIGNGSQGASATIIDATGLGDRAIQIRPKAIGVKVRLVNLAIQGGEANKTDYSYGGGILVGYEDLNWAKPNDYVSLTLENVVLNGNKAGISTDGGVGGGVAVGIGCKLTVSNSTISNNKAGYGGGIYNYGTLTIANSSITGNTAWAEGGGVYNLPWKDTDVVSLTGSTVSSNAVKDIISGTVTPEKAGGMATTGRLTVQGSSFTGNTGVGMQMNAGSAAAVSSTSFSQNGIGLRLESSATATMTNVDVQMNTGADAISAAVIQSAGDLTLISSTVANNWAGGVFLTGGAASITNSMIYRNAGIGMRIDREADATITSTSISGNLAADPTSGVGMAVSGSLTLQNSTVGQNRGVGIKINQVKDSSNSVIGGVAHITNSTIGGNTVAGDAAQGIGIENAGLLYLLNATVAHNSGAGLKMDDGSTAEVQNSILAANGLSNCAAATADTLTSKGYNLVYPADQGAGTCAFTENGDGGGDPLLADQLANNGGLTLTYKITSQDSAAVDAIPSSGAGCPAVDQRQVARPVVVKDNPAVGCDMGAYEFGVEFDHQIMLPIIRK